MSPQPCFRADIKVPKGHSFEHMGNVIAAHYRVYEKLEKLISAYNIRQRNKSDTYIPPTLDWLSEMMGPNKASLVTNVTYKAMLTAAVNFCHKFQGNMNIPYASPVTHHSVQYQHHMFIIEDVSKEKELHVKLGIPATLKLFSLSLAGVDETLYFVPPAGLKINSVGHILVRPRLGKLGVPSMTNWEVLGFNKRWDYIINHVDSQANPRWAGSL